MLKSESLKLYNDKSKKAVEFTYDEWFQIASILTMIWIHKLGNE